MTPSLHLALDDTADALLSRDPLALLVGMLLDQQFPMERAFAGPALLAERMGTPEKLDPVAIQAADPEALTAMFKGPPAIHRYPGSMAGRVQALCAIVNEEYGGDAANLWADVKTGDELVRRLKALPGFGEQKAKIFLALLGKQYGFAGSGWREAAGSYGDEGSFRSVADIVSPESLTKVREYKRAAKAAAKEAASS